MLRLPERVQVVEVAPRDGLQSLGAWVETDAKVAMIDRLSAAGFPVIEVTGFVHPRFIPALSDAEAVCARIARRPGTVYRALVPNVRGAERALGSGLDELLGLITVGETYLRKNQNMTPDEAVAQAAACFRLADAAGVGFVMAVGVALWCTYEGAIPEARVLALIARLRDAGIRRFYVAGSAGLEDPRQVGQLFARLGDAHPDCTFGYHVHDMAGMASANVLAALDAGAAFVEGAVCGIGGGVAMGTRAAIGNAPTEDLVAWLDACGVSTGLDPRAVQAAARDVAGILGIEPRSRAAAGLTRWDTLDHMGAAPTAA
ncbi:hydroxymethylglutaryl-CoA lyase [Methylobacterium sp. NEAU 140]|uniref:hydroxymethylglutaryl-CoA lyase n=1 Tax=Methylobacterium sp. NEAU 140 TaxID=3064945 RepID=UPI0027358D25|nr:hydroxymethylglutaryl-CoA lyase [Methylobacterium sp. NEAU 140]MDP4023977.1 hydroxymethylglutaryl-CoA lyase [Methylobacterium sp. NEAU 140]